jgi:hypothetical protein
MISRGGWRNLSLIVVSALLLELVSALQYYYAHGLLEEETEERVLTVLNFKAYSLRQVLNSTEQVMRDHLWDVEHNLHSPDSLYSVLTRIVRANDDDKIVGGFLCFVPNYYPEKGRLFEPYVYEKEGRLVKEQLGGKDGLDTNSNPHLARVLRLCLSKKKAEKIFQNYDVIVPSKRRYVIESLYSHYDHTLDGEHLDLAKQVIQENYKEYIPYVEKVYDRTWGYMFNMFVMPKDLVDEYCQWLFTILGKVELLIDTTDMTGFEARLFGRVSEILYNVWLQKKIEEDGIRVKEVPLLSTEPVNWWKKGTAFLRAKFGGEKYTKSF